MSIIKCGNHGNQIESALYDYNNKYVNVAEHIINPKLSKTIINDLKKPPSVPTLQLVVIVLVGLILDMMKKKKIYLLEINTQPGLTSNSLLPEMAEKKYFFELCEILINNPTCEKY